ncbi:hypothetical protein FSP39_021190 [Pinctada imbricata]|uniref:Molybdenum cofactor sulfurase middle domain-containing protein n=1 Tax=Pinctada imbricata TaxID=66713 RepID=A0AA89BWB5_PINIB|nr:hypothetical protein FSP39_021190 [Pinctada imbricata]
MDSTEHEERLEYAGSVDSIRIYPVKGCGGILVDEATCGVRGLQVKGMNDRSIMVIEVEEGLGYHKDMKNFPTLVHIKPTLNNGEVILVAPDMDPIKIPYQLNTYSRIITVR